MLEETLQTLTEQMIKDNFQNKGNVGKKYVITKQELYEFCIKLIRVVEEVYGEGKK